MTRRIRAVSWIQPALKEFRRFPDQAQMICLAALTIAAECGKSDVAKPMAGLGSGIFEIALPFDGNAFRVVYALQMSDEIWVVHAFQKKLKQGAKTPPARNRLDPGSIETIEGDIAMKTEKLELVRGSGNVFADLGREQADVDQLKAILAAEIIKTLDRAKLTTRAAQEMTGFAAADFSRVRNADLGRFTVDRLMGMLNRLGSRVEVKIRVRRVEGLDRRLLA